MHKLNYISNKKEINSHLKIKIIHKLLKAKVEIYIYLSNEPTITTLSCVALNSTFIMHMCVHHINMHTQTLRANPSVYIYIFNNITRLVSSCRIHLYRHQCMIEK